MQNWSSILELHHSKIHQRYNWNWCYILLLNLCSSRPKYHLPPVNKVYYSTCNLSIHNFICSMFIHSFVCWQCGYIGLSSARPDCITSSQTGVVSRTPGKFKNKNSPSAIIIEVSECVVVHMVLDVVLCFKY